MPNQSKLSSSRFWEIWRTAGAVGTMPKVIMVTSNQYSEEQVCYGFRKGDAVLDMTAMGYGWPDIYGVVIEMDGSNIKVRYESGTTRWKAWINLQHRTVQ